MQNGLLGRATTATITARAFSKALVDPGPFDVDPAVMKDSAGSTSTLPSGDWCYRDCDYFRVFMMLLGEKSGQRHRSLVASEFSDRDLYGDLVIRNLPS